MSVPLDVGSIIEKDEAEQALYDFLQKYVEAKAGEVDGKTELTANEVRALTALDIMIEVAEKELKVKPYVLLIAREQLKIHKIDLGRNGRKEIIRVLEAFCGKQAEEEKKAKSRLTRWLGGAR